MSQISETEIKAMSKAQNYMRGYKDGKSDVLDKIRAEIIQERDGDMGGSQEIIDGFIYGCNMALDIIDKHIAGKEEHIKSFFNADEKNGARYYLIDLKSTVRLHKDFKGDRWDRALDLVLKKIDERLGEI